MEVIASGNTRSRLDPQRKAWGILLIAFAVFCIICVGSGIGVSYFLFQSTVPLDNLLQIGRGTGGVTGQVVRTERRLSGGDVITTDRQSQATIFFRDSTQDNRLVASVTIRGDTSFTMRRSQRPRFNWGSGPYGIELQDLRGEIDVLVARDLGRDFRLTVRDQRGDLVNVSTTGQYTITVSDTQIRVINREGAASVVASGASVGRAVPVNSQGTVLFADPGTEVNLAPAFLNLLQNSTFQDVFTPPGSVQGNGQTVVQGWACTNTQSQPRGNYEPVYDDGRLVMRLYRSENATTNGETRCLRYFGQTGQDVGSFDFLSLRAMFKINFQSLNACGTQASECPLMLRLDYIDEQGNVHIWYHGFYAVLDPQQNYPLQCNSCSQEHETVNARAWYSYDSGNLFSLIAPGERPRSIISVQFYSSGHQYDVYMSEMTLLAGLLPKG